MSLCYTFTTVLMLSQRTMNESIHEQLRVLCEQKALHSSLILFPSFLVIFMKYLLLYNDNNPFKLQLPICCVPIEYDVNIFLFVSPL